MGKKTTSREESFIMNLRMITEYIEIENIGPTPQLYHNKSIFFLNFFFSQKSHRGPSIRT